MHRQPRYRNAVLPSFRMGKMDRRGLLDRGGDGSHRLCKNVVEFAEVGWPHPELRAAEAVRRLSIAIGAA